MLGVVGVLVGFLGVALLGVMLETTKLRGEVKAVRELIQHPPAPSFLGEKAPSVLLDALNGQLDPSAERHAVAFLAPGCQPCHDLADGLVAAIRDGQIAPTEVSVVVWAHAEDEARGMSERLPLHSIVDIRGALSRACEIRATPTAFIVSSEDGHVVDYTPEGSIQWVLSKMLAVQGPAAASVR